MNADIESIRRFNRFYLNYFNRFDKELYQGAYSINEASVLAELHDVQPTSATFLSHQLGLDKGQLSKIIRTLVQQGVVTQTPDPNDRRHNRLQLTPAGEQAHHELVTSSRQYLTQALADYTPATLKLMATEMQEIVALYQQTATVAIRPGTLKDIGYVADLHSRVYTEEVQYNAIFHKYVFDALGRFTQHLDQGVFWIATIGAHRVGVIALVPDDNKQWQLRWFAVEPQFQGWGVGTRLLNTLMHYATTHKINQVYLWTVDELKGARRLYAQAGFVRTDAHPNHEWCNRTINEEQWTWSKPNLAEEPR